jgi:hypothetical protein
VPVLVRVRLGCLVKRVRPDLQPEHRLDVLAVRLDVAIASSPALPAPQCSRAWALAFTAAATLRNDRSDL